MKETWDDLKIIAEKCREKINNIEKYKIVLFGAGNLGTSAYRTIKDNMNIYALADNNSKLHRKKLDNYGNLEVLPLMELEKNKEEYFVIITAMARNYQAIRNQLDEKQIKYITYMEYILIYHFDKLDYVYRELLQNDISRKSYLAIILSYLESDLSYIKEIYVKNQYFEVAEFYEPTTEDVFVDCGAFVGDSIEAFLGTRYGIVNKIYAFEPTQKNLIAMKYRMERLKKEWALQDDQLIIVDKVVDAENGVKYFSFHNEGNASNAIVDKIMDNVVKVEAISLDSFFEDKENKPTFIKADVEGSEMDLIIGAKALITKHKPKLAICVYHRLDDLFKLPLMIKELNPEYKMELRHHMPNYCETVLYCY